MHVCVLGRIGYDLYAVEHGRPLDRVEHFSRHLGGSSANIAVGLARLGLKAGIISAVGDDELAPFLLDFLAKEGVDAAHVKRVAGFNTSLCLTEICPPSGFRQVFYRANPADGQVRVGADELSYVAQARTLVTNGTALAVSPSREAAMSALKAAREAGRRTVFDVDYRASSWRSPERAGDAARPALPWIEVVLGNESEIALLTGETDAGQQIENLLRAGVQIVVRKRGDQGVEAHTKDGPLRLGPVPVEVVSTIGAGDAFAAGFLYALDRGLGLARCLHYGNAAAAIVVGRVSCSDAMPCARELEQRVAECGDS